MVDEVKQEQKPEEPKVENTVKDTPKVEDCTKIDNCMLSTEVPDFTETLKAQEKEEAEALEKHGVAIAIPEDLKAKLPEDLRVAVEAGAPVVVILDRPEDHMAWTIGSIKDFRKAVTFATKGSKITSEQTEQLQKDFDDLIKVQTHLHDRIKAVDRENRDGQDDIKKAREVLKEMEDMKKAKADAEEVAKKEHEDWLKMWRDHKNMKEKLTKTTTALQELRAGVKELHDRFIH